MKSDVTALIKGEALLLTGGWFVDPDLGAGSPPAFLLNGPPGLQGL